MCCRAPAIPSFPIVVVQDIDDTRIQLQTTLSQVQDTDYTEAITRLQKEMLGLQAAQSSFAKISKLTLFSYIN